MAITDQLGAPAATSYKQGYYTLNRIWRCEAAVAAPVTPTNLNYIVQIEIGEPSYRVDVDVYQQGGGDDYTKVRKGPTWTGTITVLGGKIGDVLKDIFGLTWSTAGDAMVALNHDDDYPEIIWEAVCRDVDNSTHLFSLIIQDLVIDSKGLSSPMEYSDETIPFHTYHMPFLLCSGSELVYDQFAGDGSTTDFTASSTPLNLTTASNYDDLVLDDCVFIKTKTSTASTGTRQKSGVSAAGGVFTYSTAPAASSTVQLLYAKAT